MSDAPSTATLEHKDAGHDHAHPPHLAHHFETPRQQYDSGKLGMWIFLATEILMFGGLFCAYAVYRANHPEVFMYAHHFLDRNLGAINTVVLIASSFTMAWAVRAAQTGQKALLVALLIVTLFGGVGFMVIKSIEYYAKWDHMVFVGPANAFYTQNDVFTNPDKLDHAKHYVEGDHGSAHGANHGDAHTADAEHAAETHVAAVSPADHSVIADAAVAPAGLNASMLNPEAAKAAGTGHQIQFSDLTPLEQERTHIFFQIYFLMTGLHGIHVLIGMGLIGWILMRSMKGDFGPQYFTPVDIVGLYWHLVDLIWIFLFPLLYLIH